MKPLCSSLLGGSLPSSAPELAVATGLPAVLTLEALIRLPDGASGIINRAKVSARGFLGWIEWHSQAIDPCLRRGRRVMAPRNLATQSGRGITVHGLLPIGEPLPLL